MQFAQVLSKLMEEKAWTQYRLAKSMDISQSTVAGWLSGTSMPRRATMKLLSEMFGVSVDYLLGKEEKENPATEVTGLTENQIMLLDAVKQMSDDQVRAILTLVQQL